MLSTQGQPDDVNLHLRLTGALLGLAVPVAHLHVLLGEVASREVEVRAVGVQVGS